MKTIGDYVFVFTLGAFPFFGEAQNNRVIELESTHEKKIIPVEYKPGAESSARHNGKDNKWGVTPEEFYSAGILEESSLSANVNEAQTLLESEDIKLLDPLGLYQKAGAKPTIVGKGSFKIQGATYNDLVKSQQVVMGDEGSNNSPLTYTVYNKWYPEDNMQNAIVAIVEKFVVIKNLSISMSEKTVFINKTIKNNVAQNSIARLYPIPTESELNLEVFLLHRSEKVELKFIDVSGNEILVKKLGSQEQGLKEYKMELLELTSGTYITELLVDGVACDRKKISLIR